MATNQASEKQLQELLLQMVETELGGENVYRAALECAINPDLHSEWTDYLEETIEHQRILSDLCAALGIDENQESPGRMVVRHIGESLTQAVEMARMQAEPAAAQLVACECIVFAETKDHMNWQLLTQYAENATGETKRLLHAAVDAIEQEEAHHLYHTHGWCRELWLQSLGIPAVLPPPEEVKNVETAIGAARAELEREAML